jgi:hypothetical protein
MRTVFAAVSAALALLIAGQILLAAYSALDPAPVEESFALHSTMGFVTVFVAVLLAVVAPMARPSRPLKVSAWIVAGLVMLQLILGTMSDGQSTGEAARMVFALHGLNAFVLAAGSVHLVRGAFAERSVRATDASAAPSAATATGARTPPRSRAEES